MITLNINKELLKYFKYCIVGAIGAVTDFSIYTLLVKYFQTYYISATIFSLSVALIVVYFLQKNWTFQYVTEQKGKTFQRYVVSVAITYLLNTALLIGFVQIVGYDVIISKIIQIIFGTVWGYFLTNFFVFNKKWERTDGQ